MKLALGALAILGGFIGWVTALDAPHLRSARNAGRFGFALAVLCIVALVAGCQSVKPFVDAARDGMVR